MLFRIVNNPRFFRPHDAGSAYFTKACKQSRQFRATFKYLYSVTETASSAPTGHAGALGCGWLCTKSDTLSGFFAQEAILHKKADH